MTDAPRLSGSDGAKGKRGFSKLLQRKKRSQRAANPAENLSRSRDSVGLSPVEVGVGRFNDEPADGVRYFMEGGCGESLASLPAVARVLSQRSGVDREQLARYLGTDGRELRSAVLDTLSFKFRGVDMALRQLFYVLRLPKE
jgi:Sec7-like guanine-nucleotide exchange factor